MINNQLNNLEKEDNKNNKNIILNHIKEEISVVVKFHTQSEDESSWNLEEIYEVIGTIFEIPIEVRIKLEEIKDKEIEKLRKEEIKGLDSREKIINYLNNLAVAEYEKLEQRINSDENLKAQLRSDEKTSMSVIEKMILLRSIDSLWVEHIDAIDAMRQGIGLRGYGQKDPLVEYKKEAHKMFQDLLSNIRRQVVYSIFKVGISPINNQQTTTNNKMNFSGPTKIGETSSTLQKIKSAPIKKQNKVGRNDLCPCGSGKKFKKCCGA